MKNFKNKVLNIVRKIPRGKTTSYKVIRFDGRIGGYNRGLKQKQKLLHSEGAELKKS